MAYSIRNLEGNLLTSKPQAHHILEGNPLTSKLAPRSPHTTFNFGRGAWKMRAMTNLSFEEMLYKLLLTLYIYMQLKITILDQSPLNFRCNGKFYC
jgi:hypothetical protein